MLMLQASSSLQHQEWFHITSMRQGPQHAPFAVLPPLTCESTSRDQHSKWKELDFSTCGVVMGPGHLKRQIKKLKYSVVFSLTMLLGILLSNGRPGPRKLVKTQISTYVISGIHK